MDVSTHFCVSSTLDFRCCHDLLMDSFARSEHVVRRQFECDEHRMDFSYLQGTDRVCLQADALLSPFANQAIFSIPLIILGDTLRGAIPTECGQRACIRVSPTGIHATKELRLCKDHFGFLTPASTLLLEITVVRDNEVRVSCVIGPTCCEFETTMEELRYELSGWTTVSMDSMCEVCIEKESLVEDEWILVDVADAPVSPRQ